MNLKTIVRKLHTQAVYESAREIFHFDINLLNEKEQQFLQEHHIDINRCEEYTHDEVIRRLKKIVNSKQLTLPQMLSSFVAGVYSNYRGVNALLSYLYALQIEVHPLQPRERYGTCTYCGVNESQWKNHLYILNVLYYGGVWRSAIGHLVDLEEYIHTTPAQATSEDISVFNKLIDAIVRASPKESAGKLEKRLRAEKVFPKFDQERTRGILFVLAELGVLPNPYIDGLYDRFVSQEELWNLPSIGSYRSDIELPAAGWKGNLGINTARFNEIFGTLVGMRT